MASAWAPANPHDCDRRLNSERDRQSNPLLNLTGKVTRGGYGSMISIDIEFGELLVFPAEPVVAPPDFSIDEPAGDRSTREEDGPHVPCLRPRGLRVKVRYRMVVVVDNHRAPVEEQSRRAEYDRPTASPCWVRMGLQYPVQLRLLHWRFAATKLDR
jgi:hypothetical protein